MATTGQMHELNATGDSRIMWDSGKPDEVEAARTHFRRLKEKRYIAYRAIGAKGDRGEIINEFDPQAERIIMVPPMVGG